MISYLIKTLLCAAAMFLIYFLLLEREKMHRFNRFYLLFSILFSLTVSFITIKTPSTLVTVNEMIAPTGWMNFTETPGGLNELGHRDISQKLTPTSEVKAGQNSVPDKKTFPWFSLLAGLYITVSALFLIRFIRNLAVLLYTAARNKKVAYLGSTLVLTQNNDLPHSFLKYIFIDRQKFEEGNIEKEILQHELTHVNQRHSLDILLVELIMVFAWINPLFFLFRRAIMLNHEYLADDAVVHTFNNTDSYRLLLFNTVSQRNNLVLSSPFNYLTTKKRLIMMTKYTSRKVALLRQIALIPLIAAIGFLLSSRVIAQDKPNQPVNPYKTEFSKTDAPQSVLTEYHAIIAKYINDSLIRLAKALPPIKSRDDIKQHTKLTSMFHLPVRNLTKNKPDKERLEKLFLQMSEKQQNRQFIGFLLKIEPKPRIVPTKEQYAALLDSKVYGIWVNGWKVKNSNLKSHSNTEYAYYSLNKLNSKVAKEMGYQISVTLQTKKYYEDNRAQILNERKNDPSKYRICLNFTQTTSDNLDIESK